MKTEYLWQIDQNKQASFRRRLFVFVGVVVSLFLIFGIWYLWLNNSMNTAAYPGNMEYSEFVVAKGSGASIIASDLHSQGFIKSEFLFKYYVWSEGKKNDFKAGKYFISPGMTIPEIVSVITDDRSGEVEFTVLEGWKSDEVAEVIGEEFSKTDKGISLGEEVREKYEADFLAEIMLKKDYVFLNSLPEGQSLEGYLFPDTYRVYRSAEMSEVVEDMLDNFGKKVTPEMLQQIDDRGWTVHDVVTLASIVQKEANVDEMPVVAGIFIARLKSGQKLESDATVNYVTGKSALQPTLKDVAFDSPYNTYQNLGLPPGPICNPGLDAIEAVLNPEITSYRYFLNAPDGATIYSETYEEHLENKARYLD